LLVIVLLVVIIVIVAVPQLEERPTFCHHLGKNTILTAPSSW